MSGAREGYEGGRMVSGSPSALDIPIRVTFFAGFSATNKREVVTPLRGLTETIKAARASSKAALPWLKLAAFGAMRSPSKEDGSGGNSLRHDANVLEIDGIEADYDGEQLTMEHARRVLSGANVAALLYTSPSHTPSNPRWRILCPTSTPLPPSRRAALVARVNGLLVGALANESFVLSQAYYYGQVEGAEPIQVATVEGRPIDLADDLDAEAIGKPERPKQTPIHTQATTRPFRAVGDGTPYGLSALTRECEAIRNAGEGHKHAALNRAAYSIGGLVTAGEVIEGVAYAALTDALNAIRHRCEDFRRAENTLRVAFRDGMAAPRSVPVREVRHTIRIEMAEPEMIPWDAPPDGMDEQPFVEPEPIPSGGAQPLRQDARKPSLPLLWFDEIEPVLDAADFVQGVLIEGSAAVIYGESNAGKTFFATDLALHVAAAHAVPSMKWNGRRVEGGGVVYCVLEGGLGFRNRVSAWRRHHALDGVELPFAAIPAALNLLDPAADTQRLIDVIGVAAEKVGIPIKLIVIDTLARAFAGGNENASEDMGALVKNMDRVREETGACVLFIHHSGKDQAKGARGHSSLRAALDTEIEVKADEESGIKTASAVKQREMKKDDVFAFTLDVAELGKNRHGEAVTTCIVKVADAKDIPERQDRLPPAARAGLVALHEALTKTGQAGTHRDIPASVKVVPVETWRREFYARSTLDSQDARKKAFQRATKDLLDARAVMVLHDMAWSLKEDA